MCASVPVKENKRTPSWFYHLHHMIDFEKSLVSVVTGKIISMTKCPESYFCNLFPLASP